MATAKKKLYFDNDAVTAAILAYQKNKDITLIHPYTKQITDLIRGVINTHKIWRFHNDLNELIQEAFVAIYAAINRYEPDKGSAFNYLSIVVKQYLKNWTRSQNQKSWKTLEFQDTFYDGGEHQESDMVAEEVFSSDCLPSCYDGMMDSMTTGVKAHRISNYQDMVRFLQSNGWETKEIKHAFSLLRAEYSR